MVDYGKFSNVFSCKNRQLKIISSHSINARHRTNCQCGKCFAGGNKIEWYGKMKWVDLMIDIPLIWSFVDKLQIHKNDNFILLIIFRYPMIHINKDILYSFNSILLDEFSSALGNWNCILCCIDGIIFCIWKIWLA